MTEVAERAGLSQQMVSYVERGMRNPTLDTLLRMANAVGSNASVLLGDALRRTTASSAGAASRGKPRS